MYRHKSLGLLAAMVVFPRAGYRLLAMNRFRVIPLAGNTAIENSLGTFTHKLLYAFMVIMPGEED